MLFTVVPGPILSRRPQPTILPITKALGALTIASLASIGFTTRAHAQTVPLPYGTVQNAGSPDPAHCSGGGWVPGVTCVHATMHCDPTLNVDDIGFTYGYEAPAGTNSGTVVALSGGDGTAPATAPGQEVAALQYYLAHNLEIVQVKWDSDWEESKDDDFTQGEFGNIQNAACRPAGLLHHVYTHPTLFTPGGGMCAHGFSAGSAAIVYVLSWFGAGWGPTGYIDNVELLSGPVLSKIDIGCQIPQTISTVNVCSGGPGCNPAGQTWSITPEYIDGDEHYVRDWSNISACANTIGRNTDQWNPTWNNMSILSSSVTSQQLSYASTSMNAWLCANVYNNNAPMNNSSSQGWLFYSDSRVSFRTGSIIDAVTNCDGPEAVMGPDATAVDANGVITPAFTLITRNMVDNCNSHH
jgi:hypothetical protein